MSSKEKKNIELIIYLIIASGVCVLGIMMFFNIKDQIYAYTNENITKFSDAKEVNLDEIIKKNSMEKVLRRKSKLKKKS